MENNKEKFNAGDKVWYINDNVIYNDLIHKKITCSEVSHDGDDEDPQMSIDETISYYDYQETEITPFSSKEKLIDSITYIKGETKWLEI